MTKLNLDNLFNGGKFTITRSGYDGKLCFSIVPGGGWSIIWLNKDELSQIRDFITSFIGDSPMPQDLTILPSNLRKAYQEGCSDVQQVLKNLFPEFEFKVKPPTYPSGAILRHRESGVEYLLSGDKIDRELRLVHIKTGRLYNEDEIWGWEDGDTIDSMTLPEDEQENFELVKLP